MPSSDEVYATFVGVINQDSARRIAEAIAVATGNGVKQIHLAFQSSGGVVGDGVFLHNLFRKAPLKLTLYNSGSVSSIAVIAYLGAQERKASARATFMIHRSYNFPQSATAAQLKSMTEMIERDDARTRAILLECAKLTDAQLRDLDNRDLNLSAEEAVQAGIAQQICEFTPPNGSRIYSV